MKGFGMIRQNRALLLVVIVSVLLLGGSGLAICWRKYTSPERVFSRMLENSFTTGSFEKSSTVSNQAQTITQTNHQQLSPEPRIHSVVEINQEGDGGSYVKRESLLTPDSSFVRLVDIKTSQLTSSGKPFDFSSITGVWAVGEADPTSNSLTQVYGQNIAVPNARLPLATRKAVLEQIRNDGVYKIDFGTVQTTTIHGRKAYVYDTMVQPVGFIRMMKAVAAHVGVTDYENVDPNSYKDIPEVKFVLTVDVLSGDLIRADFGSDQVEDYSAIGLRHIERNPSGTVSTLELQQRLQRLQQ